MKQIKQFFTRLRRKPRRQEKRGSTMAMAMIITSALVIWVMCLAPLMTTTGTAALKVQNGYTDYLGSRSAIEYAKSELVKIVNYDGKAPYTFAVVMDGSDYVVIPKRDDAGGVSSQYMEYIDHGLSDDSGDKPLDNSRGNQVAAICYVSNVGMNYEIVITSYINGVKSLTIKVPYSHQEHLMIYPEAYRQTEALPLSDYVLVDGKLGGRWVWNSATKADGETKAYEHLLPWITLAEQSRQPNYASSTKYPAVFKNTAAASTGLAGGEVVEKPDTTPKNWIKPEVSTASQNGAVKMNGTDGKTIQIYYNNKWNTLNRDQRTIYYNGSTTYPTASGKYTVTVDYKGTGAYVEPTDENPNPTNIMPCYGMEVGVITVGDFGEETLRAPARLNVSVVSYDSSKKTVRVTLQAQNKKSNNSYTDVSGAIYGYSTGSSDQIVWKTTKNDQTFDLPINETYYFYCYIPGYIDNSGKVFNASAVVIAENELHLYNYVTSPVSGKTYYLLNTSGKAMNSSFSSANFATIYNTSNNLLYFTSDLLGSAYEWKLTSSNSKWTIANGGKNMGANQKDNKDDSYSYSLSLGGSNADWTIASGNIYRTFSEKEYKYKSSGCSGSYEQTGKTRNVEMYVQHGKSSLDDSKSQFYFFEVPNIKYTSALTAAKAAEQIINPFYTLDGFTVENGENVVNAVNAKLGNGLTATLTANTNTNVTGTLNPGTYMLRGTTSDGKQIKPFQVTVKKAVLDDSLSVSVEKNGDQDHEMKATGSGWNSQGGIRYFAYEYNGNTYWDYSDSTAAECSVVFMVDYKIAYSVWVEESGTWAYEAGPKSDAVPYSITAKPVDSSDWEPTDFVFSFDEDGNVRWHSIPDGITVDQITNIVYRYEDPETGAASAWTTDSTSSYNAYGVTVAGSPYEDVANAYKIGPPLNVTNVDGHCTSMLKGSSMYFMGEGNSLNTFGNSVFLYTDLLVLKNNVTGGGQVWIDTYSANKNYVLLFAVNNINMGEGQAVFKAKHFYLIPVVDEDLNRKSVDLYSLSPAKAAEYCIGYIDYNALGDGDDTLASVRPLYQTQGYPAPNMDIAFANTTQLNAIKNGETIGWTVDGVLKTGGTSDSKGSYAVCLYINDISSASSNINYSANRVLIAAKDGDKNEVLKVPNAVTFTTRYVSVDAHTIEQETSIGAFTIKNLAKATNWLREWLDVAHAESRTLQMDYEQSTTLTYFGGGTRKIPRQVYRYEDGTNIFGSGTLEQEIMVTYSTEEINDWFSDSNIITWAAGSTISLVDRYMTLDGNTLDIPTSLLSYFGLNSQLYIYSNYIHFGEIQQVNLTTGEITINCQENGYQETDDYLGNFTSAEDSYSGTLIYFAKDITFTYKKNLTGSTKTTTIPQGFYYIFAKEGGTNLLDIVTDLYTGDDLSQNTSKKPFRVDPESLDEYSVYIRRDGGISSAYVETVLENTGSLGAYFGKAEVE